MIKKNKVTFKIFVLCAGLLCSSCLPQEETLLEPPVTPPPVVEYQTVTAERGDIEEVFQARGFFAAQREYSLSFSERSGYLSEICVKPGDSVVRGQKLASLDTAAAEAQVERQRITVEKARISWEAQAGGAVSAEAIGQAVLTAGDAADLLESLEQQLELARSDREILAEQYELQKMQTEKERELYAETLERNSGKSSAAEETRYQAELRLKQSELLLAQAENALEKQDAALESLADEVKQQQLAVTEAEKALDDLRKGIAPASAGSAAALAELDYRYAKSQLDEMEEELAKCVITAPADGTVTFLSSAAVGDYISAQTTFVKVAEAGELDLVYEGEHYGYARFGTAVSVTVDGTVCAGTVTSVEEAGPENSTPRIRIAVEGLPETTTAGSPAEISIVISRSENTLLLPRKAVESYNGSYYVYVLDENGMKTERTVQVGISSSDRIEITGGLEEGEAVILR